MMLPKNTHSGLAAALLVALASLGAAREARASSSYPPEVQKALSAQFKKAYCVPQCITCHRTNEGGFGTLNAFGKNLQADALLPPLQPDKVAPAFAKYMADKPTADSDGDGVSDMAELEAGSSPSVALPRGEGLICPDIAYGCGARVAAAPPPVDRLGLFSAGLVLFGFAALRRRQRPAKTRFLP